MPSATEPFFNVILCEDIRAEMGNKKSLMGVFGGDVVVGEFPAHIQMSLYFQFSRNPEDPGEKLRVALFQDDTEITHADIDITPRAKDVATVTMPRAIILFEGEASFRATASINGAEPVEILHKKVIQGAVQPR